MALRGIRFSLMLKILLPLFIGIFITTFLTLKSIICIYPLSLQETKDQIISYVASDVGTICDSTTLYLTEFFNERLKDLNILTGYYYQIKVNIATDPQYSYLYNKTEVQSHILLGYDVINNNNSNITQSDYSMWFSDTAKKTVNDLSDSSKLNLEYSLNMDIFAYVYYDIDSILYHNIQYIYKDGFYYIHPANKDLNFTPLMMSSCPYLATDPNKIDSRCLYSFQTMKQYYIYISTLSSIIDPFLFYSPNIIIEPDGIVTAEFCNAMISENDIDFLICIDYTFDNLTHWLMNNTMETSDIQLYIVNAFDAQVVFHPEFYKDPSKQYKYSITELEFNIDDSLNDTEAYYFNQTFLYSTILGTINSFNFTPSNGNLTFLNGTFTKAGKPYFIAIEKVFIMSTTHAMSVVITGPVDYFLISIVTVENNIDDSNNSTIYSIIGVSAAFFLILSCLTFKLGKSIIEPINNLVNHEKKLENGDFDCGVYDNFKESNYEVNILHHTFDKITKVLKYTNVNVFKENDSIALINYAEALKLYRDMGNTRALGSILFNIGSIHLKNKRFKEAVVSYEESIALVRNELNIGKDPIENYKDLSTARALLKSDSNNKILIGASEKTIISTRIQKSRRMAVDGLVNDKKTLKMMEVLSSRLFQLANAYMLETVNIPEKDNWDLVLHTILEVIAIERNLISDSSRKILSYLITSKAFYEMIFITEATQYLELAENDLPEYQALHERMQKINDSLPPEKNNTEKKNNDIPPIILKQKIMYQKGLILRKLGQLREACEIFTACLETGKIYDPEIRKICLENLKMILEEKNLLDKAPNILRLLESNFNKKNNDIIFLLDISESMGGSNKEDYALREILKFFDKYMDNNDRVGFIRFNHNVYVVFELSERGKNHVYLRYSIQASKEAFKTGGETAFFSAIFEGLRLFKNAERKENKKWIIALTDGEDNSSKITYDEILELVKGSDVSLIIIGLALNPESVAELTHLARVTKDGVFIESGDDTKNIEIAFQTMKKQIFDEDKKNVFLENLE